jgi:hypothetical protein
VLKRVDGPENSVFSTILGTFGQFRIPLRCRLAVLYIGGCRLQNFSKSNILFAEEGSEKGVFDVYELRSIEGSSFIPPYAI